MREKKERFIRLFDLGKIVEIFQPTNYWNGIIERGLARHTAWHAKEVSFSSSLRGAEVGELGHPVGGDQDVGRLQIRVIEKIIKQ